MNIKIKEYEIELEACTPYSDIGNPPNYWKFKNVRLAGKAPDKQSMRGFVFGKVIISLHLEDMKKMDIKQAGR